MGANANGELTTWVNSFGFLPRKWELHFEGGRITPHPGYDEAATWVESNTNVDGFLYPPIVRERTRESATTEDPDDTAECERPARMYKIDPSHNLHLSAKGTKEDLQRGPGSFVIHLLAYLFGTRLEFSSWWLDGRVPIRRTHNINLTRATAEDFLSHSYGRYSTWGEENQKLITNVLVTHSRAPSYEWDWEQFIIEYMVFDGCWKLGQNLHALSSQGHGERIREACRRFKIPINEELVGAIVDLRNDLMHETLWDRSRPTSADSSWAYLAPRHLRRLNQRLVPALLGYLTPYVATPWWSSGTHAFPQWQSAQGDTVSP